MGLKQNDTNKKIKAIKEEDPRYYISDSQRKKILKQKKFDEMEMLASELVKTKSGRNQADFREKLKEYSKEDIVKLFDKTEKEEIKNFLQKDEEFRSILENGKFKIMGNIDFGNNFTQSVYDSLKARGMNMVEIDKLLKENKTLDRVNKMVNKEEKILKSEKRMTKDLSEKAEVNKDGEIKLAPVASKRTKKDLVEVKGKRALTVQKDKSKGKEKLKDL